MADANWQDRKIKEDQSMKRFILVSTCFFISNISIIAMQQPPRVYDPGRTNMLKSLLNVYPPLESVPESQIVQLVSEGADPNVAADCGYWIGDAWLDALIHFRKHNNHRLIDFMLCNGANPESKDALSIACQQGDCASVALLLAHGANSTALNEHGDCPLMYAIGDPEYPELYRNTIIKHLLEKGAGSTINTLNKNGETPLIIARKGGLHDVLKLFEPYIGNNP